MSRSFQLERGIECLYGRYEVTCLELSVRSLTSFSVLLFRLSAARAHR